MMRAAFHAGKKSGCDVTDDLLPQPEDLPALKENAYRSRTYWIELPTEEKTLLAPDPINRMVPTTTARITASITAYSATSWPSSSHNLPKARIMIDLTYA
jgi:hypothetical protein